MAIRRPIGSSIGSVLLVPLSSALFFCCLSLLGPPTLLLARQVPLPQQQSAVKFCPDGHCKEAPWRREMPAQFVERRVLPFLNQFRQQLNARSGSAVPVLNWMDRKRARKWPSTPAKSTHVDLDPPEQRALGTRGMRNLDDLGGLIAREVWKRAMQDCVSQGSDGQLRVWRADCGFPYQLFFERAKSVHCKLVLEQRVDKPQPRAEMKCQTDPPAPSARNALLANNFQKDKRFQCLRCGSKCASCTGKGKAMETGGRTGKADNNIRIWTDRKFTRIYEISDYQGTAIAEYINRVRAQIAKGESPNLPVAAGMNRIRWKRHLASEALAQMDTRDNDPVNVVDLGMFQLLDGAQKGGKGQRRAADQHIVSGHGKNYVDLNARNLLLKTVHHYMELFANQHCLRCAKGICKATCLRGSHQSQLAKHGWKTHMDNPADFHRYPYELLYDRARSVGCAVRFHTKHLTQLQAKLVCVMENHIGHASSISKFMHRHNVFKVGLACSQCETGHGCDKTTRLCSAHKQSRDGADDPAENDEWDEAEEDRGSSDGEGGEEDGFLSVTNAPEDEREWDLPDPTDIDSAEGFGLKEMFAEDDDTA